MANGYIRIVKRGSKLIIYHVVGWLAFIAFELLTIHFVAGRMSNTVDYVSHYFINIILFYTNTVIITRNSQYLSRAFLMIFEIGTYILCNYILNYTLEHLGCVIQRPMSSIYPFFISSFWRCLYFIGLSSCYGFAVNLINSKLHISNLISLGLQKERDQAILEKNLLLSQNNYLRAQVKPHLFFNTLNFVYNSVYKASPKAGEAVLLLSDITRYSISATDENGLVDLRKELAHLVNLIELNQLRFNHKLQIQTHFCEIDTEYKIIPLVFLTLVENVFKYGDLFDSAYPAIIKLEVKNQKIHFSTFNKKVNNNQFNKSTGIGLSNTAKRLQIAYYDHYDFSINESQCTYQIYITIPTQTLCSVAT